MIKRLAAALIAVMVLLVAPSGIGAAPGGVQLSVSLDSAYLLMGNVTPLRVKLLAPADSKGQLLVPRDSMCGNVEILKALVADTSDAGNGRMEISGEVLLQSFDSGVYQLKPILYVNGSETIASNRLALKVIPVDVDSLATIHDFADVQDVDRKFIDYLPDFVVDYGLWILALIIVCGVAYWLYIRFTRKQPEAKRVVKPVPPYERAVRELENLRSESLCEKGREKEFYTRLTDILRIYLHGRFGINAMEMTSSQIRAAVNSHSESKPGRQYMEQVLEIADFVKFAKMRPLPDDNVRAFNSALTFVNDTKPLPEPVAEPADNQSVADNNTNKNSQN